MKTPIFLLDNLIAAFFEKKILTKNELLDISQCSNMTLFRRLSEHGYFTSYNLNSRYYTIPEVARFDKNGLWRYDHVRFSKFGTLKATIHHFVDHSEMGYSVNELNQLLGVRVSSLLLPLTNQGVITREYFNGWYYFATAPVQREQQLQKRRVKSAPSQTATIILPQELDDKSQIEALVGLVKNPEFEPKDVRSYLKTRGIIVSLAAVKELFDYYDLSKKKDGRNF
jgi:hypothetical protein